MVKVAKTRSPSNAARELAAGGVLKRALDIDFASAQAVLGALLLNLDGAITDATAVDFLCQLTGRRRTAAELERATEVLSHLLVALTLPGSPGPKLLLLMNAAATGTSSKEGQQRNLLQWCERWLEQTRESGSTPKWIELSARLVLRELPPDTTIDLAAAAGALQGALDHRMSARGLTAKLLGVKKDTVRGSAARRKK